MGIRHGPEGPNYMAVGYLSTCRTYRGCRGLCEIVCAMGGVNKTTYAFCSRVALQRKILRASLNEGEPCTPASSNRS